MKIQRNLPIMVLVNKNPHKLLFQFKSVLWACIALFISSGLGLATYLLSTRQDINRAILAVIGSLSVLFLYSSIYSFKMRRSLEINEAEQAVKYNESGLYKTIRWKRPFNEFKCIKIFRPTEMGSLRPTRNWTIQLISNKEDVFPIGYNQFGALTYESAKELADRIANIMQIKEEITK